MTPYHIEPVRVLIVTVGVWAAVYVLFAVAVLAMTRYATQGWMRGER